MKYVTLPSTISPMFYGRSYIIFLICTRTLFRSNLLSQAIDPFFYVYYTLTHAFHSRPDQPQPQSQRDTISAVVVLCVFDFDSFFSFQTRPVTTRVPTRYSQRYCGSLCILL